MRSIILSVFLFSAISCSFLRNLADSAAITVDADGATYPTDGCPSIGYAFNITGAPSSGNTLTVASKLTTDKVVLVSTPSTGTAVNVATSCEIPILDAASSATITCKTTSAIPKGTVTLKDLATAEVSTGVTLTITAGTNSPTFKSGYLYLGSNKGTKTIKKGDVKEWPYTFDIAYASTLTKTTTITVKAGEKALDCSVKEDLKGLTCKVEKDDLAGDKDDSSKAVDYSVTVSNACSEQEDTGIVLSVSAQSFVKFSSALIALALFLF